MLEMFEERGLAPEASPPLFAPMDIAL